MENHQMPPPNTTFHGLLPTFTKIALTQARKKNHGSSSSSRNISTWGSSWKLKTEAHEPSLPSTTS